MHSTEIYLESGVQKLTLKKDPFRGDCTERERKGTTWTSFISAFILQCMAYIFQLSWASLSDLVQGLSLQTVKGVEVHLRSGHPSLSRSTHAAALIALKSRGGTSPGFSESSWGQECGWEKGSMAIVLSSAQDCSCCLFCFYLDTELQTSALSTQFCFVFSSSSIVL